MKEIPEVLRVAAVGDIHCHRRSKGLLRPLFAQMSESAEVILLCGDLTDYGLPEEAHVLAEEIAAAATIPVIAVLGNHDFEAGKQAEVASILEHVNVAVLDGGACEIKGVGFAGIKGFAGGFGRGALEPWGEPIIKHFVEEAVAEAVKLESALARLHTAHRVAVLHYAPIRGTVEGEPLEIYPYLGSRRLEEPLNRFKVAAVFHGHAHSGMPEGKTSSGTPVFNVALPLLRRCFPEQPTFRIHDVVLEGEDEPVLD